MIDTESGDQNIAPTGADLEPDLPEGESAESEEEEGL